MVTEVKSYKTADGKLFDSHSGAAAHEASLKQMALAEAITSAVMCHTRMGNLKVVTDNILVMFDTKSTRNIIKELLEMMARGGNQ